jgi:E3 ubiquitin-protein ligase SHPRH
LKIQNANNYLYKWWIDALDRIESSSKFEEFWSKLANYFSFDPTVNAHKTKETTNNVSIGSAYIVCGKSVKSINELKLVLANQLDNVIEHRNEVKSKLDSFSNEISSDVVAAVADCHLRREMFESKKNATNNKNNNKNKNVNDIEESPNENKSRPLCAICKCDNLLKKYAHSLFSKSDESIKQFANQINEGEDEDNEANEKFHSNQLMNSSDLQNCLKVIHYCCRGEQEHNEKTNPGKDSLEFYTMLCEEYNIFVRYWMSVSHQIGALDELEMVKTRMRLLQPDEKNIYNYEYIIEPRMVQIHFYKYKNDLNTSQYDLKKKLGQLLFLKNLQKSHLVQTGQENTDICPICQCNLGTDWYMLSCGHSYCKECLAAIKKNENHVNITCPMCRETIDVKNEAYLVTAKKLTFDQESDQEKTQLLNQNDSNDFEYGNNAKELEKIKIIGECNSAKVEGVVKCLISILTKDKLSKCIVFSEHSTILELIASLLKPNLIVFKLAKDPSSLKTCINEFKEKANLNVLLMPYHLGANGLNIIEATHVLLVEPTLNKSQEVQAIGRVHRIGQTKPTYVYRFHIRNTIEELVYKLFNKSSKTYQTNSSKANSSKHFEQAENSSYGEKGFSIEDLRNLYAQL